MKGKHIKVCPASAKVEKVRIVLEGLRGDIGISAAEAAQSW